MQTASPSKPSLRRDLNAIYKSLTTGHKDKFFVVFVFWALPPIRIGTFFFMLIAKSNFTLCNANFVLVFVTCYLFL